MTTSLACDDVNDIRAAEQAWMRAMQSTEAADRAPAEAAVEQLYRSVDRAPPRRIVWASGPRELAEQRERSWLEDDVGANLAPAISERVARASSTYADAVRSHPLYRRRSALIGQSSGLHAAVTGMVDLETSSAGSGLLLKRIFSRLAGRSRPSPWLSIGTGGRAQTDAPFLCCEHALYSRYGTLPAVREALSALATITTSAGWIVPHEQVCWLGERFQLLKTDARGRLHAGDGPALRYADGFEVHAWKGIQIPSWLIEFPDAITPSRISSERDQFVRRCMIEILTPARFIAAGGAKVVARDETGTLWAHSWGRDTWAAVEVVNGTPEPDGSHKHYFLQVPPEMLSARQAVAWTYDLTEKQYKNLVLRT